MRPDLVPRWAGGTSEMRIVLVLGLAAILVAGCVGTGTVSPAPSETLPSPSPSTEPPPTPDRTPSASPTSRPSLAPSPSATPSDTAPLSAGTVQVIENTAGVHRGDQAVVAIRVQPESSCTLSVEYGYVGRVVADTERVDFAAEIADIHGSATWRWVVDPVDPVSQVAHSAIECHLRGQSMTAFARTYIWPAEVTPTTTLATPFVGTWRMSQFDVGAWTLEVGSCQLGKACGQLNAARLGCAFPLTFAWTAADATGGGVVLEVGDGSVSSCVKPWGYSGLYLTVADDGLRLGWEGGDITLASVGP
jgi:hypothetical protein